MKIPKKLKIQNMIYKVVRMTEDGKDDYFGKSSSSKQRIAIADNISRERQEMSFFHELFHAILDEGKFYDESKNEQMVNCLANGIYQILKNTKFLK